MILIVGGAGYIGSHVTKELNHQGYQTIVFDNLSTGNLKWIKWGDFIIGDLGNIDQIREVFKDHHIDVVIHLAASKSVGESVVDPQKYYYNNVVNTLNLLQVMLENSVKKIIFSSSCATFGVPLYLPIDEDHPQNPINPYGESKLMIEKILKSYSQAYDLRFVCLRYFNAAGADPDLEIGEQKKSINLIPLLFDTATGRTENIKIYGTDYPTLDGTCIRDYIHVSDLADAHFRSLKYLEGGGLSNFFNLGNSKGFSVREVISSVIKITGRKFKVVETERRKGDPPVLISNSEKSRKILLWSPRLTDIDSIVLTAWNWYQKDTSI